MDASGFFDKIRGFWLLKQENLFDFNMKFAIFQSTRAWMETWWLPRTSNPFSRALIASRVGSIPTLARFFISCILTRQYIFFFRDDQ